MTKGAPQEPEVEVRPVTPELWSDLEELFERRGPRGGTPMPGSCWCMWWRERNGDAAKNKAAMQALVASGTPPGLLAYWRGDAGAWVAVAPRADFTKLVQSRIYRPVDEAPDVWAITCFYTDPRFRGHGLQRALLEEAVAFARANGAAAVEAYPLDGGDYMGHGELFAAAGFVARREAGKRTVVRLTS